MTVINLPTEEKLSTFALSLHFKAWEQLHQIIYEFDSVYEAGKSAHPEEWREYLELSSQDLETIINLIAQASEIRMKSILCATSPYLLLLGQSDAIKTSKKNVEFSELRTLDAVDLPAAIHGFTPFEISDEFLTDFSLLRRLRNKSTHLGEPIGDHDPQKVIEYLVRQYETLWPQEPFLAAWLKSKHTRRSSFFADGKYSSIQMEFYSIAPDMMNMLTKSQFHRLLKKKKSTRRYICWSCLIEAQTRFYDFHPSEISFAYLSEDGSSLHCLACDTRSPVIRKNCAAKDCRGNVISEESPDIDPDFCHSCGQIQSEIITPPRKNSIFANPSTGELLQIIDPDTKR